MSPSPSRAAASVRAGRKAAAGEAQKMTVSSSGVSRSRATTAAARADGGDELRPHVRLQDEPRGAPDREERDEVEEVPVLDELPRREAEIERGDLKDQQRDEREQERCKGVCVTPAPVDRGRHEPRGREDDREDSDAEGDLVEMLGGRAPQAVRNEIALERDDVVADDVSRAGRARRAEPRPRRPPDRRGRERDATRRRAGRSSARASPTAPGWPQPSSWRTRASGRANAMTTS